MTNIDTEFQEWYNSVHDNVANKNKHWSTFQVNRFVKNTHRFLKLYGMCFLSGAYVFEDPHSLLFNLLTYGKFEKTMPHATRNNPNPTTDFLKQDKDNLSSAHVSGTHNVFIKHNEPLNTIHHNFSKTTAKFERLFNKSFRAEPFEYLCDLCVDSPDVKNKEEKRVILYYPFLTKDTKKNMLYLKYESYPMNAKEHAFEFLGNVAQSRANEYAKRRENGKSYDNELKQKDLDFYRENFPEDLSSLEKYNQTYREGDEFFVGSNLLKYMLMTFLDNSDTPVCDFIVTKRLKSNKRSSKRSSSSKKSSSSSSSKKSSSSSKKHTEDLDLDMLSQKMNEITLNKKKGIFSKIKSTFKTKKGGKKQIKRKTRKARKARK